MSDHFLVRVSQQGASVIFGQDRKALRRMYVDAWRKRTEGAALSPLEAQIADVVELHPEYQLALSGASLDVDYTPEAGATNPFLHMGLHLGVREQVATDRPPGIRSIFEALAARQGDQHAAEHQMLECLAETLWEAQGQNSAPDERRYLERLKRIAGVAT
jgi:hypothetical protein